MPALIPVVLILRLDLEAGIANPDDIPQQLPYLGGQTDMSELYFWKEVELPFLPQKDFIFRLNSASDADIWDRYVKFEVQELEWNERNGCVVVSLTQDQTDDPMLASDLGPEWHRGAYWVYCNPHAYTSRISK